LILEIFSNNREQEGKEAEKTIFENGRSITGRIGGKREEGVNEA
jgi:hypothetical protein